LEEYGGQKTEFDAQRVAQAQAALTTEKNLFETFRKNLIYSKVQHADGKCECHRRENACDTLGLLGQLRDEKFRQDFLDFATGDKSLHQHRLVYNFCCLRIYAQLTDQQPGEACFSGVDEVGHGNMSISLLAATVQMAMNGITEVTPEARQKFEREVRARPKDYNSLAYVKRHTFDAGEDDIKDENHTREKKTRRRACKEPCTCCYACGNCPKKYVSKSSLMKHLITENHTMGASISSSSSSASASLASACLQSEHIAETDNEADDLPEAKVFCLCRAIYDEDRYMVECDHCEEWYHLSCLLSHWGVLRYEFEGALPFFCEKPACKKNNIDFIEWGGKVVDVRQGDTEHENELYYNIEWDDGSPSFWASEDQIPNECLLSYRLEQQLEAKKMNTFPATLHRKRKRAARVGT
jgi:hypothetical protein